MMPDDQILRQLRDQIQRYLQADHAVIAAAVLGSLAERRHDTWSDLDLLIVVEEASLGRFFPTLAWLQPFGVIFACEQSSSSLAGVTRVCFTDFRRVDCVITTEAALTRLAEWPQVAFWRGTQPLFSRSVAVTQLLAQAHEPPAPAAFSVDQFEQLTRRFWFNGVVATTKVVRGDPLIALHLALDMLRDCCLLALLLRDRDTGTTVHRESVVGQAFVAQLASASRPFTGRGILTMLEQTAIAFDDLASQWSPAYEAHRYPLLQAIDRAHRVLAEEAP
jgi:predicted nucleotidyltransferase